MSRLRYGRPFARAGCRRPEMRRMRDQDESMRSGGQVQEVPEVAW